jgi:hypothetical protein
VFQRIFGAIGFFAVPMAAGGLHVMAASLFISATVIGVALLNGPRGRRQTWIRRQGLLLTLVGVWSLLSLAYFASRSYTATLIGGHVFQIGLVIASFLPLIDAGLHRLSGGRDAVRPLAVASLALGLVARIWALGTLQFVHPPSAYAALAKPGPGPTALAAQLQQIGSLHQSGADQLLDMPALTSLLTGFPSHPVVNSPSQLGLSRSLAALQCTTRWPRETLTLVVSSTTYFGLRRAAECWAVLDLARATPQASNPDLMSVPVLG